MGKIYCLRRVGGNKGPLDISSSAGTQTLGEEYCNLAQINQYTQTFPGFLVTLVNNRHAYTV